jgi:hypothetical protein
MKDLVPCDTISSPHGRARRPCCRGRASHPIERRFVPAELAGLGRSLRLVLISLPLVLARMDRGDEQRFFVLVVCLEGQENFSANCFARASAVASAI